MTDTAWLTQIPIAHRGLHDSTRGLVENSPSAFRAAIAAGYAIELDLRLSRDGEVMVFHDATLDRLTRTQGALAAFTARELSAISLGQGPETIPRLGEILDLVGGRVPLLLELKVESQQVAPLAAMTAELLAEYRGAIAVQSFNPYVLAWYRAHASHIPRGLLSCAYRKPEWARLSVFKRFTLRHLLTAPLLQPQFIAYDIRALPAIAPGLARKLGLPVLAWTVLDDETRKTAASHADNIIFEGFRPPNP